MDIRTLKNTLKTQKAVITAWLSLPCVFSAEVMAHQDWDCITVDTQHGIHDFVKTTEIMAAVSPLKPAMVRVPWLDAASIMKALDGGAAGIICPMINNKKQAEQLVQYTHYPPIGERSFGPLRSNIIYGSDYPPKANDELLILAMIETQEAFQSLTDILSVPHIDGVFIGPGDLSYSFFGDLTPEDADERLLPLLEHIIATTREKNKIVGGYTFTPEYSWKMIQKGMQFVALSSDIRLLQSASLHYIQKIKKSIQQ